MLSNENGALLVFTTILFHEPTSSSPAFLLTLKEEVPEILLIQLPYMLRIGDTVTLVNDVATRGRTTILTVDLEIFGIGEVLNLTYFATLDPENTEAGNVSKPVIVNYTTIKQEGIGLMVKTRAFFL